MLNGLTRLACIERGLAHQTNAMWELLHLRLDFVKTQHHSHVFNVAQVTLHMFLVPQVENCQSPVFVIVMSRTYCHHLRRVDVHVSYQVETNFYLQAA